jgi:hypothetical protein
MEKDSNIMEVGKKESKAKLPPELRIIVWKNFVEVVPRIICIRWVQYFHQFRILGGAKTFEVTNSYVQPTSLNISPESRQETSQYYQQILSDLEIQGVGYYDPSNRTINAKAGSPGINFNFEVDTLTFCPDLIRSETFEAGPRDDKAGIETKRRESVIRHMGPSECFDHFKTLLKVPENNFEKVQFLALGHFRCFIDNDGGDGDYTVGAFIAGYGYGWLAIGTAFENLKQLILVVAPWAWKCFPREYLDLSRTVNQENVRQRVNLMYREENERRPACKIPEIVFVTEDDPRAPRYPRAHKGIDCCNGTRRTYHHL